MTHRRDFLKASLAGTGLVTWGLSVPHFLTRTAAAAGKATKDNILVIVELTGGNDGLNTVVPYADDNYAKVRTVLRLPTAQIKKLNDKLGLHPSMEGLAGIWEDQSLCVVQGVGYPNPSQSHFRSMDI